MISVVIPVYNVKGELPRCIESVLCQTYPELEVLLVDDGSDDGSGAVCDRYAALDARIRVLHQKNTGLSGARNRGIAAAKGEYILLADSDDFLEPQLCERMYTALLQSGASVAVCGCIELREKDGSERSVAVTGEQRVVTGAEMLEKLNGDDMKYYVTAWNRLYRAELLKQISFPAGRINEDLAVAHEIYHSAGRIVLLPEALYHYRLRDGSITGSGLSVRNLDAVEAIYRRFVYYRENGLEQLLPGTVRWARRLLEIRVHIAPHNAKERARIRQIYGMFRTMYFSGYAEKSRKDTLAAAFPGPYFAVKKLLWRKRHDRNNIG